MASAILESECSGEKYFNQIIIQINVKLQTLIKSMKERYKILYDYKNI